MTELSSFARQAVSIDRDSFLSKGTDRAFIDCMIDDLNQWAASDAGREQFNELISKNGDDPVLIQWYNGFRGPVAYNSGLNAIVISPTMMEAYEKNQHPMFMVDVEANFKDAEMHLGAVLAHELGHATRRENLLKAGEYLNEGNYFEYIKAVILEEERAIKEDENPARQVFGLPEREVSYYPDYEGVIRGFLADGTVDENEKVLLEAVSKAISSLALLVPDELVKVAAHEAMSTHAVTNPFGFLDVDTTYSRADFRGDMEESILELQETLNKALEAAGMEPVQQGITSSLDKALTEVSGINHRDAQWARDADRDFGL